MKDSNITLKIDNAQYIFDSEAFKIKNAKIIIE